MREDKAGKAFHPLAWLAWLAASLTVAMTTRNPFYLALLVGMCGAIYKFCGQPTPLRGTWGIFLRVGVMMWLVATLLNLFTVHYGESVIVSLPPEIPVIGGPITWEALIFGAMNGLTLVAILAIFGALNSAMDFHKALKFVPHSLFEVGLTVSIAAAFIPQTLYSLQEIREAQALRGHRLRGIRDMVPLFIPLITTGLERSIQLAESMECRGFGSGAIADRRTSVQYKVGTLAGLAGLLVGLAFYYYLPTWRPAGVGLLAASLFLLAFVLWEISRGSRRSHYRRERWQAEDWVVAIACGLTLVGFLAWGLMGKGDLAYYPYPRLTWPSFEAARGAAILLLVAPAAMQLADGKRKYGL